MADSKPWEKQDGETDAAYSHFLIYRNFGPARSIDSAYAAATEGAPKRAKTRQARKRANGTWKAESVKYEWTTRAEAWDVEVFSEVGTRVVVNFIGILEQVSKRTLAAIESKQIAPRDLKAVMEAIVILGNFIPAETVAALRDHSRLDRAPAIGSTGAANAADGAGRKN